MTRRNLIVLAAGGSLALLAGAFLFQALGFAPCKMCLWQRWPHGVAVALGAVGLAVPAGLVGAVAGLGALAALTTGGLGLYHTGVERDWWAGPASCTSSGGGVSGLSGSELLSVEGAGRIVMCDEVVWSLFGLSMASWNAILSVALAGIWLWALRRPGGDPAQPRGGME